MTPAEALPLDPPSPRYRRWVEVAPTAAYTCDRDGRVLAFNAEAVELWGAEPRGGEQERYCGPVRLVMADGHSRAPELEWLAESVRTHRPRAHGEARLVRQDGSIITAEFHIRGVDDTPGEPLWSGIALFDVTQRTRMEALHLEHARLLESIATGAPLLDCLENVSRVLARLIPGALAGVFLANEDRTELTVVSSAPLAASFVTGLNALRGEELFAACGLDRLSRMPRSYSDLRDPRVPPGPWRDLWLTHDLRSTLTVPILLADGPAVAACFLAFASPHEFDTCERQLAATGAHIAGTAIARDQLQRSMHRVQRQLEERLDESLKLHHATISLTADCRDDAWQARLTKAATELVGADVATLHLVEEDSRRMTLVAVAGATREHVSAWQLDDAVPSNAAKTRHQCRADGPGRTMQSTYAAPLQAPDGELLGLLTVHWRDRRVSPEQEPPTLVVLAQHATNLVRRCRAEASLVASQRSKDEFLAQLAHELRNPLAPIRNASQLLRRRESEWPEVSWCRDIIDRQVTHLTRLIDDLLDVSRIGQDRLTLRRSRLLLDDVLRAAIETTRTQFEQKEQQLVAATPSAPIWLDGDSVRLTQVFINLLTNASKYTEPGGRIDLEKRTTQGHVEVIVRDTGVGLSPAALARIFELFYQVDRTLERAQGGLGIGLSLVKRLVELHGGTVLAESDGPGRGSRFTVRLPLAGPPAAAGDTEGPAEPVSDRESRRILVVDDNPEIADSLSRVLRNLGHDVWTAPDGAQGVAMAQQVQPDAVILDLSMPHMDGYEACRRIRATEWGKHALLVAVTAHGFIEDRLRGVDSGFDFHLTKPADPDQIARLIKALSA